MCAIALLYVIVRAVLCSVIDETINIYKLKLNWIEIEILIVTWLCDTLATSIIIGIFTGQDTCPDKKDLRFNID